MWTRHLIWKIDFRISFEKSAPHEILVQCHKTFSPATVCIEIKLFSYRILSSIMRIRVQCTPEFRNDSWQKNYFYFSRIISQELIIASLFIIKAILNPFLVTFHVLHREYFSIIFNVKKCAPYSLKYGICKTQSVVNTVPEATFTKRLLLKLRMYQNKLECLSLESLFSQSQTSGLYYKHITIVIDAPK